ncbi:MAG: HoxN/HupN/NixA family nickel/cobalt transporter [Candidatus Micrarchaeota archaeon]|nr:HoxN/HupN/NixA family nickel/cobalt transporter [Candidatus Micrarchaeota archaeon]
MAVKLSSDEKAKLLAVYGIIIAVTLAGFTASVSVGRTYVLLAGLSVLAYVLGLRHAVDADHIAAIDNTTRKLMQEGGRPLTVGTWFSLGHSTIVVCMILALVFVGRAAVIALPWLQNAGPVLGTTISGIFLWIIGILNLVVILDIYRVFARLRAGELNEPELEELLNKRGFMNRYLGGMFRLIRKPWQIYPIGLLFGLGFDTASEVALIAISLGVGVASAMPVWMVLVLPLMFTCGMVIVDTSDGVAMSLAYGWAFLKPIRKVYYNLTITIISVLVALFIGTVELIQVLSGEFGLSGGVWAWLAGLDFETMGIWIIALFIASWMVAIAIYRYKDFENRGYQLQA